MSMFEPVGGDEKKDKKDEAAAPEQTPTQKPPEAAEVKTLGAVNLDQFNTHMQLSVQALNRLRSAFTVRSS